MRVVALDGEVAHAHYAEATRHVEAVPPRDVEHVDGDVVVRREHGRTPGQGRQRLQESGGRERHRQPFRAAVELRELAIESVKALLLPRATALADAEERPVAACVDMPRNRATDLDAVAHDIPRPLRPDRQLARMERNHRRHVQRGDVRHRLLVQQCADDSVRPEPAERAPNLGDTFRGDDLHFPVRARARELHDALKLAPVRCGAAWG